MVEDNVTGLIWERKENKDGVADYTNPHDADNTYTWCDTDPTTNGGYQGTCGTTDTEDFINALNSANFGGYNDWRLPTIKELRTLVDRGQYTPSIDSGVFPGTVSAYYWSSTTNAFNVELAWHVNFVSGSAYYVRKSSVYYVRAVRGGQCGSLGYSVISASAGVNGSLDSETPSPQTVPNGSATQFTFNASTGYHVATVTGCGVSYSNSDKAVSSYTATTGIVTGDCTVFAQFKSFPWTMFLPAITNK